MLLFAADVGKWRDPSSGDWLGFCSKLEFLKVVGGHESLSGDDSNSHPCMMSC